MNNINRLLKEAEAAQAQRNFSLAESLLEQVRKLLPGNIEIEHMMAVLYYQSGDTGNALLKIKQCVAQNKSESRFYNTMGMILRRQECYEEAEQCFRQALNLNNSYYDPLANLGNLLSHQGRVDEAEDVLNQALAIKPNSPGAHLNLGNAYRVSKQWMNALRSYEYALKLQPNYVQAWYNKALILNVLGKNSDAMACCEKALQLFPNYLNCQLLRGELYQQRGELQAAETIFKNCIQLAPSDGQAYWALANMGAYFDEGLEQAVHQQLANSDAQINKIYFHFTLAKVLESREAHEDAFAHLRKGNALKRTTLTYNREFNHQYIKTLQKCSGIESIEYNKEQSSARPIFIVGMPRSGTSLIERIIGSAKDVAMGDELNTMMEIMFIHLPKWTLRNSLESLSELTPELVQKAAGFYLKENAELVNSARYFTDKLPFNFAHIGVLSAMFPNAKFVHIYKNPMDSCLSCYKQLFTEAQEFSYDLDDLASFYKDYRLCMEGWQSRTAEQILHLSYERLIAQPEQETQKLFDFLGLQWSVDVLNFKSLKAISKTASSSQIRSNINQESLYRWVQYGECLKPLSTALQRVGIEPEAPWGIGNESSG